MVPGFGLTPHPPAAEWEAEDNGKEIEMKAISGLVDLILDDHEEISERLAEWAAAAELLDPLSPVETRQGIERLAKLVPYFEKELGPHFLREERVLFAHLQATHPSSSPTLEYFLAQHAELNRQWQTYKQEWLGSSAQGEVTRLRELSLGLARRLRQHIRDEERDLLPLAEKP